MEWNKIDDDNLDGTDMPNDFEPVLCLNRNNDFMVLELTKYGNSIHSCEWQTVGLRMNTAFSIDFVQQWCLITEPIKED